MSITVTTAEQRVDWERHRAVRDARVLMKNNFRDVAVSMLLDSVHKQARWSPADGFTMRRTYVRSSR